MKRIIGLFLVLNILFAGINVCAENISFNHDDDYTYNIRVMKELGLVPSSLDGLEEKIATRADAAKIFAALFPLDSKNVKVFPDVEAEGELGNAVYTLQTRGIVTGNDDFLFLPDSNVTGDDLVCMGVRALGAGKYAEETGGYPVGYYSALTSVFDIRFSGGESFTVGDVISFARKIADSNIVVVTNANGIERYDFTDGKTLLSVNYGIKKCKGKVTGNRITGLHSRNAKVKEGIRIDNEEYLASEKYDSLLGYNTEVYYKLSGEQREIVSALPLPKDNEIVTFENENIPTFNNNKYTLAVDRKNVSYDVGGDDFAFIYNGVACSSLLSELFEPEKGRITLIDTDKDGIYNVVSVESGESYYVDEATSEFISVRNGEGIALNNDYTYCLEDANGNVIGVSDIPKHSIITVFRAYQEKHLKIVVSDNEISGILKEFYTDPNGKIIWVIDDDEYTVDDKNVSYSNVRVGMRVTVMTDCFNIIMSCKLWDGEYYFYAVLGEVGKGGPLGDSVMFKMYDSDGVIRTVEGGDKIDVDGKVCVNYDEIYARLNIALCYINYYKETKKLENDVPAPIVDNESIRQFVRYRLNNSGKIIEIDTAAPWMDDDYENTLHFSSISVDNTSKQAKRELSMLGSTMTYDSETVFFWINKDKSKDDTFYVEDGGKSLLDDFSYNVEGYYVDEDIVVDYVVVTMIDDERVPIGDWNRLVVVDQKITVLKNDETYNKIAYYEGYNYVARYEALEKTKGLLDGIDRGDIIRLSLLGSEISEVEMIYDYSEDKISGTKGDYFGYPHIMAGDVYTRTDGRIVVTTSDVTAGTPLSTTCYIYDAEKFPIISIKRGKEVIIEQGSTGDIRSYENFNSNYSRVFVHMVGGKPITMIVLDR